MVTSALADAKEALYQGPYGNKSAIKGCLTTEINMALSCLSWGEEYSYTNLDALDYLAGRPLWYRLQLHRTLTTGMLQAAVAQQVCASKQVYFHRPCHSITTALVPLSQRNF